MKNIGKSIKKLLRFIKPYTFFKGCRAMLFVLCMCMLAIAVSGCGDDTTISETEENSESVEGMKSYSIYYINNDWTEFEINQLNVDQMEATENIIDKLMNSLITIDEQTDINIPVPEGLAYQRYIYDGQRHVTLMFNVDYETADKYNIVMCKMAFTKTLCQIDGIDAVNFEMTNLIDEEDVQVEEYNEESFVTLDSEDFHKNMEVDYPVSEEQ